MEDNRPKTIICDIDGTLIPHQGPTKAAMTEHGIDLDTFPLPGVSDKLVEWDRKGYNIILLTGRKESMRENTEKHLASIGIFYDQLVMGVGGGPRILINDKKPDGKDTAFAINVERNKGLNDITV